MTSAAKWEKCSHEDASVFHSKCVGDFVSTGYRRVFVVHEYLRSTYQLCEVGQPLRAVSYLLTSHACTGAATGREVHTAEACIAVMKHQIAWCVHGCMGASRMRASERATAALFAPAEVSLVAAAAVVVE